MDAATGCPEIMSVYSHFIHDQFFPLPTFSSLFFFECQVKFNVSSAPVRFDMLFQPFKLFSVLFSFGPHDLYFLSGLIQLCFLHPLLFTHLVLNIVKADVNSQDAAQKQDERHGPLQEDQKVCPPGNEADQTQYCRYSAGYKQ